MHRFQLLNYHRRIQRKSRLPIKKQLITPKVLQTCPTCHALLTVDCTELSKQKNNHARGVGVGGGARMELQSLFRKTKQLIKIPFYRGPAEGWTPVIKCRPFLSLFQRYIVRDISLTEIYRWLSEILSAI